ncbi:hypothetical protein J2X02_002797 [Pseudoxanthomonas japonensis]|uniref:Uncharacterized protein n=1 Tax=Archangium gephyra TaxID=48 RepID=A0A2W5UWE6_9BACT|nr:MULTISPECIES: hypothetical protein [Pseudoxanthomonas]MBA3928967.1 hypothetical protein [Xanthomonas sp.]MDR7069946.1 hypothetical protein [Pseudoxanthomonas japonensis]PZR02081.1 MAG: hypothetical protein DI536_37270 [Archangium gephyra]
MEYVIRLDDVTADLADIERHLVDLDPAVVVDLDATSGCLRCSTSALAVDLMLALADAGHLVAPEAIQRLPSVCCGGCGG